jgi:PadR family transcriptional regulator PadR
MTTQENKEERIALLQGTLDLLILKTLVLAPCHGQGVARLIQRQSEDVFLVDHGSLYVALQRLEDKKWIRAKWGVSENNRKARFYSLTPKGREHLVQKTGEWRRLTRAMGLILDSAGGLQRRGGIACSTASVVPRIFELKKSRCILHSRPTSCGAKA